MQSGSASRRVHAGARRCFNDRHARRGACSTEPERSPDEAYMKCALLDLQRMRPAQRQDVRLRRQQAFHIADPSAGTYAQLVEAAENCQVSIIHPGKPRNLKRTGT